MAKLPTLLAAVRLLSSCAPLVFARSCHDSTATATDGDGCVADEDALMQLHLRRGDAIVLAAANSSFRCCYGDAACADERDGCNPPDHYCSGSQGACIDECRGGRFCPVASTPTPTPTPGFQCCYVGDDCGSASGCNPSQHYCSSSEDACRSKCRGVAYCPVETITPPPTPPPTPGFQCCYLENSCGDGTGCNPSSHECSQSESMCMNQCYGRSYCLVGAPTPSPTPQPTVPTTGPAPTPEPTSTSEATTETTSTSEPESTSSSTSESTLEPTSTLQPTPEPTTSEVTSTSESTPEPTSSSEAPPEPTSTPPSPEPTPDPETTPGPTPEPTSTLDPSAEPTTATESTSTSPAFPSCSIDACKDCVGSDCDTCRDTQRYVCCVWDECKDANIFLECVDSVKKPCCKDVSVPIPPYC